MRKTIHPTNAQCSLVPRRIYTSGYETTHNTQSMSHAILFYINEIKTYKLNSSSENSIIRKTHLDFNTNNTSLKLILISPINGRWFADLKRPTRVETLQQLTMDMTAFLTIVTWIVIFKCGAAT